MSTASATRARESAPSGASPSEARPRLSSRVWARRRALLLALVVAGAFFAVTFRSLVVRIVPGLVDRVLSRQIGYRLVIESLDFQVGSMRLVGHDLSLVPLDGGPPVATCSRAEARLDPSRLFRGVVIDDLELDGVRIRARRLANGSLDVIETIASAQAKRPPATLPFHIETLRCREATIVVTEAPSSPVSATPVTHTLSLDVLAERLGTMRLGPPALETGDFTIVGSGGDLADRVSIVGDIGPRDEDPISATVALARADPSALAASAAGSAEPRERVDIRGAVAVFVRRRAGHELDLELLAANLSVDAGRERPVSVRSASARLHIAPGQPVAWREITIREPRIALERRDDGSLTVAGVRAFGPSRPGAGPARDETSADLLDRLEAASVSSGSPTAVSRIATRESYPWPACPDAFTLEDGELRIGGGAGAQRTELAVTALSVVERVERGRGSPRLLARVDAVSPGVAEHVRIAIDGVVTDRALAGSVELSIAGVTTEALARLGARAEDLLAPGGLDARATFELARESRTRLSGELSVRDARFRANGETLARIDALDGAFSLDLGREPPSVRVSRVVVDGAWAKLTRSRTGALLLAGVPLGPPRAFATEAPFDLDFDRVELRHARVRLDLRDGSPSLESDLTFDGTLARVTLGGAPGLASVAIHGAASGLVRDLSVEGRVFTSRVSPAAILEVRATGLRTPAPFDSHGVSVAFDDATLEGRVAWALVSGPRGGREVIARVSSVVLADRLGPGLSLDAGRADVSFPDSPNGVVEIDGVALVRPRATIEPGPRGVTVARAITWAPSADLPDPAALVRPPLGALRIRGLRVEDGEIDVAPRARDPREVVRVRRIEARAARREVAAGRGETPLEVDVSAVVAGLASAVHVTASLDRGTLLPRLRAEIDARGVELSAVGALWSGVFQGSTIHDGTFHAGVEVSVRRLLDGSLAGGLAVRDLSLEGDARDTVFSLAEGSAREISYQPRTGELFVGGLDLARPHLALVRERTGELVVGGLETGEKAVAPGEGVRVEIDHLSVGGASVVFEDRGARDARGQPPVWTVTDGNGCAARLVFGRDGFEALSAFFAEGSLGTGTRFVADGTLLRERRGLDGWATIALRDLDVTRISPYTEVARRVRLERGTLTLECAVTLSGGHADGDLTVLSRKPRVRRLSSPKPAVEGGSERGPRADRETVEELDTDASLEVPFGGELSDLRVKKGLFVGRWLGSVLLDVLEQPLKLLRPTETPVGTSIRLRILRVIRGPKAPIAGPITARAVFAPGGASLTEDGARAVATIAPYASDTERDVSLRAVSGVSDRALVARAGQLTPRSARELWARFGARRAALEDERRERAGAERAALERGDAASAQAIREEVIAVEKGIATLDRSLDDLGNRIVASGPALDRGRSDEALSELARQRVEAIRAALVRAGVDPRHVRVNLAHLHGDDEQDHAGSNEGRVEIEVLP